MKQLEHDRDEVFWCITNTGDSLSLKHLKYFYVCSFHSQDNTSSLSRSSNRSKDQAKLIFVNTHSWLQKNFLYIKKYYIKTKKMCWLQQMWNFLQRINKSPSQIIPS